MVANYLKIWTLLYKVITYENTGEETENYHILQSFEREKDARKLARLLAIKQYRGGCRPLQHPYTIDGGGATGNVSSPYGVYVENFYKLDNRPSYVKRDLTLQTIADYSDWAVGIDGTVVFAEFITSSVMNKIRRLY